MKTKNIITTAALLIAGTALANATDWTVSNNVSETVSNAWFTGLRFNLSSELENSRLKVEPTSPALDAEVSLDSFTINIRSVQGKSLSLLLCDADKNIVSVSTNSISATGDAKWTFENTKINTTSNYFVYYIDSTKSADATSNIGSAITTADSTNSWVVNAGGGTLANYGNQQGNSSLTFIGSDKNLNYTSLNNQNYSAKISIGLSSISEIPEPSMFGVLAGLGALALVGARRRRKI